MVKEEVTLFSIITNHMHFGMTIVGLPYSFQGQMALDEVVGAAAPMAPPPLPAVRVNASPVRLSSKAHVSRAS